MININWLCDCLNRLAAQPPLNARLRLERFDQDQLRMEINRNMFICSFNIYHISLFGQENVEQSASLLCLPCPCLWHSSRFPTISLRLLFFSSLQIAAFDEELIVFIAVCDGNVDQAIQFLTAGANDVVEDPNRANEEAIPRDYPGQRPSVLELRYIIMNITISYNILLSEPRAILFAFPFVWLVALCR